MIEIKLTPHGEFSETRANGPAYRLLNDKLECIHNGFFCKDFFNEIFCSLIRNVDLKIYGFSFRPDMFPEWNTVKRLNIALNYEARDKNNASIIPADYTLIDDIVPTKNLLNKFERIFGLNKTEIIPANEGKVLIFSLDKGWTARPYLMSLYAMCMRIGPAYNHKGAIDFFNDIMWYQIPPQKDKSLQWKFNYIDNDIRVIRNYQFCINFKKLMSEGALNQSWDQFKFETSNDISLLHNYSGLMNYTCPGDRH